MYYFIHLCYNIYAHKSRSLRHLKWCLSVSDKWLYEPIGCVLGPIDVDSIAQEQLDNKERSVVISGALGKNCSTLHTDEF